MNCVGTLALQGFCEFITNACPQDLANQVRFSVHYVEAMKTAKLRPGKYLSPEAAEYFSGVVHAAIFCQNCCTHAAVRTPSQLDFTRSRRWQARVWSDVPKRLHRGKTSLHTYCIRKTPTDWIFPGQQRACHIPVQRGRRARARNVEVKFSDQG